MIDGKEEVVGHTTKKKWHTICATILPFPFQFSYDTVWSVLLTAYCTSGFCGDFFVENDEI